MNNNSPHNKHSPEQVISRVNKLGFKNPIKYRCSNPEHGRTKHNDRLVEIQRLDNNEKKIVLYGTISKGVNPFLTNGEKNKIEDSKVFKVVNEFGKKASPQFICSNALIGRDKHGGRLIQIQNVITKELKNTTYGIIKAGKNPFGETQNREELKNVQPMYRELFEKYKIEYVSEFSLGNKFIDFKFEINGVSYGLEVKQSFKWYSRGSQVENYKKIALNKYNMRDVFLSDPLGNHHSKGSISIKEFENLLLKLLK